MISLSLEISGQKDGERREGRLITKISSRVCNSLKHV